MREERDEAPPRWGLAGLYAAAIAGYPLVASVPVALNLGSRMISVPYRAVILGVSLGVALHSVRRKEQYAGGLWMPLGVFWVLYTARMLVDTVFDPVPLGRPATDYFLYAIGTCLIPMVALLGKPSDATIRLALRMTTAAATAALVAVAYVGVQSLRSGDFRVVATGRFELATLNPISLGHLGVSLATLALFQLRTSDYRPRRSAIVLIPAVALGLLTAGVAASKGPLVALLINLGFLFFLDWREGRRGRALIGALAAPLVALPAARYLEEALGFTIISRIELGLNSPERFALLKGARDQFLAHPFVGSSLDERVSLTYPHNTFLESFMAIGALGGLCYAAFHLIALWRALLVVVARPGAAWVGILCVQYTVGALLSGSLYTSNTMWALLAAVVAVADELAPAEAPLYNSPSSEATMDFRSQ